MITSPLFWGFRLFKVDSICYFLSIIVHLIEFKNKSSTQTYKKYFFYKETILHRHYLKLNVNMQFCFSLSKIWKKY